MVDGKLGVALEEVEIKPHILRAPYPLQPPRRAADHIASWPQLTGGRGLRRGEVQLTEGRSEASCDCSHCHLAASWLMRRPRTGDPALFDIASRMTIFWKNWSWPLDNLGKPHSLDFSTFNFCRLSLTRGPPRTAGNSSQVQICRCGELLVAGIWSSS